jgi:CBS domain-containing protein
MAGGLDARTIQPAKEPIMRVRELMNRNLVTISESSSCHEAVARMHRARIRHLPVLSDDGALVGVVTDRDLRHYLFRPDVCTDIGPNSIERLLKVVTVDEIMSAPVLTVDAADEMTDAARIMLEDKVGSLPVTEGGRLVGIITETDVLREICRGDAACPPEVTDIVVSHR